MIIFKLNCSLHISKSRVKKQLGDIFAAIHAFLQISGLQINCNKSHLIGCNVEPAVVVRMAREMKISVGTLPMQYLEAPLGGNPRMISFWRLVIERVRKKSGSWNSKFLS